MNWVSLRSAVATVVAENLGQNVAAFNQNSNGAILLSGAGNAGDFVDRLFFGANDVGGRRDRTTGVGSATPTGITQRNDTEITVSGRFGALSWNAQDPQWQGVSESGVVQMLATKTVEYVMKDQINTSAAALVAALTQAGDAVTDISANVDAVGAMSFSALNQASAKLGDAAMGTAAVLMNGAAYHGLVGDAIGDSSNLFTYEGIMIRAFGNKLLVVVDAPALTVSTTDYNTLILNGGAAVISEQGSPYVIMTEKTGDNATLEYQADYSFNLGLKGFAYGGTANPTDVELATGANWTKTYGSAKNGAGALLVTNQFIK